MPVKQPKCVHCGSTDYVKNGSYRGVQRYRCRECGRAFSDRVRKFTYDDKARCVEMCMNNTGIRKAALFMGCSSSMPVRWVREFAENLRRRQEKADTDTGAGLPDVIETDGIYTGVKKGGTASRSGQPVPGAGAELSHT